MELLKSVFYIASFSAAVAGIFFLPKTQANRGESATDSFGTGPGEVRFRNGVRELSFSVLTVLCIGAAWAYVLKWCSFAAWRLFQRHVWINLISVSWSYLLTALLCFFKIKKEKKRQRHIFRRADLIGCALAAVFMILIFFLIHGRKIALVYTNIDLANHFDSAVRTMEEQSLYQMHFTPFHHAMMMRILSPFFKGVWLYKSFLIADALMTGFELIFFLSLFIDAAYGKNSDGRLPGRMKVLLPAAFLLFACGMPLYGYAVGGFCHWGAGAMVSVYSFYMFQAWREHGGRFYLLCIVLGLLSVLFSYYLFLPPVVLGIGLYLLYTQQRDGKLRGKHLLWIAAGCVVGATLLLLALRSYFNGSTALLREYLTRRGTSYSGIYADLLLPVPFALFVLWRQLREKGFGIEAFALFSSILYAAGFYLLSRLGIASDYYYYKTWYLIWVFVWILNVRYFAEDFPESRRFGLTVLLLGALFEALFLLLPAEKPGAYYPAAKGVFGEKSVCSEEKLALFDYAYYESRTNYVKILFAADNDVYSECLDRAWYDGLTEHYSGDTYGWESDLPRIVELLKEKQIKYCIVLKDSTLYSDNGAYIAETEALFENEAGVILKL